MKIFTNAQIRDLDRYTMEHEPIRGIDLMERAAKAVTNVIIERWPAQTPIVAFAGPGNNGGDALAVSRMLAEAGYRVEVYLFNIHNKLSEDCETNRQRARDCRRIARLAEITLNFDPPVLDADTVVIDGLFGSGLNKPLAGGFAALVKYINQSAATVVSIDIPSGLMTEDNTYNISANIVRASLTLTFQQKKLSMLLADNQPYIGELRVLDIRLSQDYIRKTNADFYIQEEADIRPLLRPRADFSHKGQMGNALLIAGNYGMAGASVLAAKACLRTGVGKLTAHIPRKNYLIMQAAVPEAMVHIDHEETCFSSAVPSDEFDALAIGPGIGRQENTAIAMIAQLRSSRCPVVADADALNILAEHRAWIQQLPKGIILTPHPKEFDRLSGGASNGSYERLINARDMASRLQAFIILKGHYSALCLPDGKIIFNPTGNSGMATAGSGDVLTGIILGLLARGYERKEACMVGMFLHGLAGDLAAKELGKESLVASDIIRFLPQAYRRLDD